MGGKKKVAEKNKQNQVKESKREKWNKIKGDDFSML